MQKLHISAVKLGDKVAKTIFTDDGKVLLASGIKLNDRYIQRLLNLGIDEVYIEDPGTIEFYAEDVIRGETRKQAVESIQKTMTSLMDQPMVIGRAASKGLGAAFRQVFGAILKDLMSRKEVMVNMTNLHVHDGGLFHHSVNVAVLAGIMGISKGYTHDQLEELGMGALLFDIGMTYLPKEMWNKRGPLTEDEWDRLRLHPEEGFNILRYEFDVPLLSAHCALQHHERFDGSGYPRGLKGDEIHEYAQIIAIADVYDALTSPRVYRQRFSPSEAIEYLFAAGNRFFNHDLIKLFCSHIAIYPVDSTVLLSTGQKGIVTAVNPLIAYRPVIKIIEEPGGSGVASAYEIDLTSDNSITIVKTVS